MEENSVNFRDFRLKVLNIISLLTLSNYDDTLRLSGKRIPRNANCNGSCIMDYTDLARKWAKAIAFAKCGKLDVASTWAQSLVDTLRANGIVIR